MRVSVGYAYQMYLFESLPLLCGLLCFLPAEPRCIGEHLGSAWMLRRLRILVHQLFTFLIGLGFQISFPTWAPTDMPLPNSAQD